MPKNFKSDRENDYFMDNLIRLKNSVWRSWFYENEFLNIGPLT